MNGAAAVTSPFLMVVSSSNDKKLNNIDSEWLDKSNNNYKLIGKYLFVTSYAEFTSNGYSIVDYINDKIK